MAQDNAFRLISKIVSDRDMVSVSERGITADWFTNAQHRMMFDFIVRHYSRYGEVPTRVTFRDNFPATALLRVEDTIEYLIEQMVASRRQHAIALMLSQAVENFDNGDHEAAAWVVEKGLAQLSNDTSTSTSDIDLVLDPLSYLEEYDQRAARGGGLLGLPTGFNTIDQATAGIQPGQLVTIVATPKAGKSTLAMKIALNIHELGHPTLFQSFEMSNREQRDRHHAMRAGIAHARLIRGNLRRQERDRLEEMLKGLSNHDDVEARNSFVLSDAAEGLTLSAIRAKLTKHRPDILLVDGVYLMYDEITGERNTPQSLTNLTRGFKALAQQAKIPVIVTTQALAWKMKGTKLSGDSIGYSSSFFQDSDVILGLEFINDLDSQEAIDERLLKIVASRNCGPAEVPLNWDWENAAFTEFSS